MASSGFEREKQCCRWDKNIVHEAYQFLQQVLRPDFAGRPIDLLTSSRLTCWHLHMFRWFRRGSFQKMRTYRWQKTKKKSKKVPRVKLQAAATCKFEPPLNAWLCSKNCSIFQHLGNIYKVSEILMLQPKIIVLYNLLFPQARFFPVTQGHATLEKMNHILTLLNGSTLAKF